MKLLKSRSGALRDGIPYYIGRNACEKDKTLIKFTKTGKCANCNRDKNNYIKMRHDLVIYTHYVHPEDIMEIDAYIKRLLLGRGIK